jgi:hypothetical protein
MQVVKNKVTRLINNLYGHMGEMNLLECLILVISLLSYL